MQEPPKPEQDEDKEPAYRPTLNDDQKDRPYYYDDAHGYETYSPDLEDEEIDALLPGTARQTQPRQ